jgi:hypothetical protein
VAPALAEISTQPEKDLGQRVRTRRQELGLPVVPTGNVLPLRAQQPPLVSAAELTALDTEPPAVEHERAVWRVRLAERRMQEAYFALEEAEQRSSSLRELERFGEVFTHESATFDAAVRRADVGQPT